MRSQVFPLEFRSGDRRFFPRGIYTAIATAVVLGLGCLSDMAQAHSAPLSAPSPEAHLGLVTAALPPSNSSVIPAVAGGTYLFGDTQVAGQLGHEYWVMQVDGDQVVGGLYEANASFSCLSGNITAHELSLTVQDSKRPGGHSYTIPIYLEHSSGSSRFVLPYENTLGLQGTYQVEEMDAESRRVLEFCRTSQSLSLQYEATYSFLDSGSVMPVGVFSGRQSQI